MFFKLRIIAVAAAAVAIAGCASGPVAHRTIGSPDPGFGETTRHNAAVQIIDPDPVYTADASQPGDDGAKSAAAYKRYRTDAVKVPETTMSTQSGSSGSGSGGR